MFYCATGCTSLEEELTTACAHAAELCAPPGFFKERGEESRVVGRDVVAGGLDDCRQILRGQSDR